MRTTCVLLSSFTLLAATAAPALADDKVTVSESELVEWGFGAHVRQLHASRWVLERFWEDVPGGAKENGVALDFTRRTRSLEFVFSLGYDELDARDGNYLELGEDPVEPGTVAYLDFQKLAQITIEATIVGRAKLHKILALRYGAGLGVGIVRGEVIQTDMLCASDRIQTDCTVDPDGEKTEEPADVPPVLPVVNIQVGVELRLVKPIALYADVGIHSVPFVSAGATFYLW
jgi:hypothetical protein